VLTRLKTNLDAAQKATLEQTSVTLDKVGVAFREAATESVTSLYKFAIVLVLLALLVTALMPESPFRKAGAGMGAATVPAGE